MSKSQSQRPDPQRKRVLVIGDIMLDSDIRLTANRLSGEGAPVAKFVDPVYRPGGAGAVAVMAAGLGAEVHLFGVAGTDGAATLLKQLLDAERIGGCLLLCQDRKTTQKSRVFIDGHQAVRIDEESTEPVKGTDLAQLVGDMPREVDVVLIADYAKGVVTPELMRAVRKLYGRRGVPVIVDPAPRTDWERYREAYCLTPNRVEFDFQTGWSEMWPNITNRLCKKRDRDGMEFIEYNGVRRVFPAITDTDQVIDTCGAGDMVLAALGVFLANGASWERAAELANVAAGLKCRKQGAVPVSLQEIGEHVGVPAGLMKLAETITVSADVVSPEHARAQTAWTY